MVYLTDRSLNSHNLHCLVLTSLREITFWSLLGLKGSNDVTTLASRNFDEGVSSLLRKMALILLVWFVYNYYFNTHSWQMWWFQILAAIKEVIHIFFQIVHQKVKVYLKI